MKWVIIALLFLAFLAAYPVQMLLLVAVVCLIGGAYSKWGPTPEERLAALQQRRPADAWGFRKLTKREYNQERQLEALVAKRAERKLAGERAAAARLRAQVDAERRILDDTTWTHDEVLDRLPEHLRREFPGH